MAADATTKQESLQAPGMRTERTTEGYKHFEDCFLCGRAFQFGPNRYAGRAVAAWRIRICETCERSNWDGLVPEAHPKLMKHLADANIDIRLNDRGWLAIPGN